MDAITPHAHARAPSKPFMSAKTSSLSQFPRACGDYPSTRRNLRISPPRGG